MRRLVAETSLEPRHLVLPMFVADGISEPRPIGSMPGVFQHTRDSLRKAAAEAVAAGVGGLMLFGVPTDGDKDSTGSAGVAEDGILNVALRDLAADLGSDTVLMADTCLDEFTDHAACGRHQRYAGWSPKPLWNRGIWYCRCSSRTVSRSRSRLLRCREWFSTPVIRCARRPPRPSRRVSAG